MNVGWQKRLDGLGSLRVFVRATPAMSLRSTLRTLFKKHSGLFFNALFLVAVLLGVGALQKCKMLPTSEAANPRLRGPRLRGGYYDLADVGNRPVLVYFLHRGASFARLTQTISRGYDDYEMKNRWRFW